MKKPVILVVGDAVAPTGFTRVTHSILARLSDRFSFHQLGINYNGDPHQESWPIYPASLGGDPHGVRRIAEMVSKTHPDAVLIVNDLWIVGRYIEALSQLKQRPPIVAYMPVDAEPVQPEHIRRLGTLDQLVVYTEFGAKALEAAAKEVTAVDPAFRLPPLKIIAHGIDSTAFRPLFPLTEGLLKGRRGMRRNLLPQGDAIEDAFIVLNANRNQPRKAIDVTIAGFARFAADKPENVRLYLHMGTTDLGWDVCELARRHGIQDRLMLTHSAGGPPQLGDGDLNLVYNACDVGLNTSTAEGWGLVSFEHAATGAAQLVPNHSGMDQVWGGAADLLPSSLQATVPGTLGTAHLIAPATVAAALQRLYDDPEELVRRSLDAYRRATEPRLSWDAVAEEFDDLLGKLINTERAVR